MDRNREKWLLDVNAEKTARISFYLPAGMNVTWMCERKAYGMLKKEMEQLHQNEHVQQDDLDLTDVMGQSKSLWFPYVS